MERQSAFDRSLTLLTLRDHSAGELKRKLAEKGYAEEEIGPCLARLAELGYLDDLRFARGFASSSMRNGRGVGAKLRMELSRRGVDAAIVGRVLAELAEEYSEKELLAEIVARRYPGFDPQAASDKEKRRVIGYLQRKGFSLSAIFAQLKGGWEE